MVVSKIKIKEATIYGFGKWVDYSIDLSKEPLICIYGENESGKTTLQNFIMFMLFGLPPKKRAFFRPKTSGKMGGRLTIYDPEIGEYTIERLDEVNNGGATCYLSTGLEYGDDWLRDQLKGMTREIYRSIFSFSALDLKDFSSMKNEDLGEILLGIGLTGSNNIHTIEKQLDQKIGKIFKPTGKIPIMNQQLESLDDRLIELTNAKNKELTYRNKQEQIHILLTEIESLQKKLQQTRERQLMIEKHQRNIPIINDYHLYTNQLLNHQAEQSFPENGIERLNILKEQLLPFKSEFAVLKANHTQHKKEWERLQDKLLDESIYESAQSILRKELQFDKDKQEFIRLEDMINTLNVKIDTRLNELHIGLTSEALSQITLSFYTETTWKELKNKIDQLQLEKEQLVRDQQTLRKQQQFLSNQLEEVTSKLLTSEQQDELYARLDIYKEHDFLKRMAKETSNQQLKWKKTKQQKERNMKSLLIASVVLGVLLGSTGLFLDLSILYYMMTVIFIIGFGQWIWGKKSIKETTRLLASQKVKEGSSKQVTMINKQEAEELLMKDDESRIVSRSIKEQLKSIDIQLIQWNEKQYMWQQRETSIKQQISTQIDQYPFLEYIDLEHWPDFFHTLKQLLDRRYELQEIQAQAEEHKGKIVIYHQIVKGFFDEFYKKTKDSPFELQLVSLKDIVVEHEDSQRLLEQCEHMITENEISQADIKQKMKVYERELQALFTTAQVETEDDFYKIEKANKERQTIEIKIDKADEQLQAVYSQTDWKELTQNKPNQDKLEIDHQMIIQQCEELEEIIHINRQELADLHADVMNMETSEVYSQTMHRFTIEKEQLSKQAREWAVLKIAKEMLVETKHNYRDKYLTSVINRTSTYFSDLTKGVYINVIPPTKGKPFQVETVDRMRYHVNELSQGTIDQLYVCLRLSISEIMSEKHALPFIIDDAFVHFDNIRTKRMMKILSQIARKQQVIIFTCRHEIQHSLQENSIIYLNEYDSH